MEPRQPEHEIQSQNEGSKPKGSEKLHTFGPDKAVLSADERSRLIHEPAEDTIIWKYLDLAKYLALLKNRCLHMAPAAEFWDRYEGDIGLVQKKLLVRKHGQEAYEHAMTLFQKLRERTYVSCWTENEFESDAMWKIFTGANYGVAIRSTYGQLRSLLPDNGISGKADNSSDQRHALEPNLVQYCGRVNYVDFKKDLLELQAFCVPFFYKRKSFEHEREVRVIVQDLTPESHKAKPEAAKKIPLSKKQINELILSVHLSPGAPEWFRDLVREINADYGLDRDPQPSSLDEIPE